jgi:hypothetical protein
MTLSAKERKMENNSPSKDIIKSIEENTTKRIATDVAIGERNQALIMKAQAANDANAYMVNQTMHQGFGELTDSLDRLTDTVQKSAIMIYTKLDAIHKTLKTPRKTAAWELCQDAQENFDKELYEEARDQLLKAVELHNENYAAWYLLGMVYYKKKGEFGVVFDLEAAIAAFSNAVKYITPDARAHEELRSAAAVCWAYLGIARFHKRDNLLLTNGGSGGEEAGRFLDGALEAFEQSCQYKKDREVFYQAARCKALRGDKADALSYLETLITVDGRYEIKTKQDSDFDAIREDFNRLIEKMRTDYYRKAKGLFAEIQSVYAKAQADGITQYFPSEEITEINRIIPALISENLMYLDMRERSESYSSFLARLKETVLEAEAAKRRAEEKAAAAVATAEAAKERRQKHREHIILCVVLYLVGSAALIGGGIAASTGGGGTGGILMLLVFLPIVGGLVGYSVGDNHHPVFGVIIGIAATIVCGVLFSKNGPIGAVIFGVLWVVGGVLVTLVKTRNDDGYGKNKR